MFSHQMSSDQVLNLVVEQAIYPITTNILYSLFAPFGVEQLVVYPQTKLGDGEPCVAADVRFTSAQAAAHAFAYWDGRCIYYRCCRLQMWCATLDVLPAPASTSPTVVKDNRDTAVDLNNYTTTISDHDGEFVGAIEIPAAASTSTSPHGHDTFTKSSLDNDCCVLVAGTDDYTLVAAIPEIVTELAVFPGVPSTTKAQEDLEVIHDAPPARITMAHVTYPTECSHQVATTDILNEGLGLILKDAIAELMHTVTPIEMSSEIVSLEVCGTGQGVVAIDVNAPTTSVFTGSSVWPSSNSGTPEYSLPSRHNDVQQVFEPMPFDKPEDAVADVKKHKDDAKLTVLTLVVNPSTWYEHFSPRDPCFVSFDAQLVFEEHMRSEPCLTWPPLVGANFSELCSSGQFDSDCTLSLFPWNPGGYLLKHSNRMTRVFITANSQWPITRVIEESSKCFPHIVKIQWLFTICLKTMTQFLVILSFANLDYELWPPPLRVLISQKGHMFRPRPWPSFDCFQADVHLKYAGQQVTYVMNHFSGVRNFPRESWRYLQTEQQKPRHSGKVVCCIHMILRVLSVPRQMILQLMENVNSSAAEWRLYVSTELQGYDIPDTDCESQPKQRSLFKFSRKTIQLKPPWPSFSCNCHRCGQHYLPVTHLRTTLTPTPFRRRGHDGLRQSCSKLRIDGCGRCLHHPVFQMS
ncbi:hypothetical protein CFC21_105401 [Triticum aestivum]|uniref:PTBP1-like RNA recognition motif 2 domain-containing protein n=2 Tax=Triticum aestivum TaxID=4565 RepID=A0A3B6SSF6_WHEAT|nr:hypothetical protein CFC21_105401 [Triticum aestivum]